MDHFLLIMFRVCHAFLSVHCSLVATCWGGVLGQVCYLIVSIPDLCLLTYFVESSSYTCKSVVRSSWT